MTIVLHARDKEANIVFLPRTRESPLRWLRSYLGSKSGKDTDSVTATLTAPANNHEASPILVARQARSESPEGSDLALNYIITQAEER
jgi:hypothetical protein